MNLILIFALVLAITINPSNDDEFVGLMVLFLIAASIAEAIRLRKEQVARNKWINRDK